MSENQISQPAGLARLLGNRRLLIYGGLALVAVIITIIVLTSNSASTFQVTNSASGHAMTLLVDPQHAGTVYAGNDQGKVFLSNDGGQTWTSRSAGLPGNANAPISALLEQSNDAHLYAGTDGGVYGSIDGGQHWTKTGGSGATGSGLPGEDVVDALAFGSADGKTILAGTARGGVYISHDGGTSWQASGNGLPDHADIYGLTATPKFDAIFAALIGA
ncbi:MAG TPA: YCF48-related protein, partial [Ktedonobacterales bacterium]|nr:YCF48-related protein [Ktedonobacterales bacterium]